MNKRGGWRRFVSLGLAIAFASLCGAQAMADDVHIATTRAALVTLAVDREGFAKAPEIVRCPMFGVNLHFLSCVAVNASGQTVGQVTISTEKLAPSSRRETLDRCAASDTVKANCVAELRASISPHGLPEATELTWVTGVD